MISVFLLAGVLVQCLGVSFSSPTTCFQSYRLLYIQNCCGHSFGGVLGRCDSKSR
eukprot:jgi/Botrbrau1/14672/Bobra.0108s0030.1